MKNAAQTRILAVALALATIAVCVFAAMNFEREGHYFVPTDGAWWVESTGGLRAERVPAGSPADRAGVRAGDVMVAIDDQPTPRTAPFVREMFHKGIWAHANYSILRAAPHASDLAGAAKLDIQVILEPTDRSINQGLRLIALVYLCIGIYVLFRRWTAPKSTHFYIFCLVSFVLYSFKYTTEFDTFDQIVYWCNILAAALQPALFLHFAFSFYDNESSAQNSRVRRHLLSAALYIPGIFLVGLQFAAITFWSATELLRHRLDQIAVGYLALYSVIAAIVFEFRYRRAESALERQQLKWLTRGTLIAVTPFTLLYAIPYMADFAVPTLLTNLAGFSLIFLPLTFSWAIVRYRLMDVDLIFKRGVTYTLATAALVGLYFAVVAMAAEMVHTRLPTLRTWGLVAAVIITGLVFDPLKRMIQGRVDRVFDQKPRPTSAPSSTPSLSACPRRSSSPASPSSSPRKTPPATPPRHAASSSPPPMASPISRPSISAPWTPASWTSTSPAPTTTSSLKIRSRSCACRRPSASPQAHSTSTTTCHVASPTETAVEPAP